MNIHQLNIFVSVYKNRSFTKASEELGLSQPTVSEQIKNLEEQLNCRLFDRLGRSIQPTTEADILYPKAVEIIEEIEELKGFISESRNSVSGTIHIGASTIPGTYILPRLAAAFKRQYPDVSFEIEIGDSQEITDRVLGHDLILGFTGAKPESDKIQAQEFLSDRLILAATPDMIKTDKISIKELIKLPFILRERGSGTRKTMEVFLGQKGISIKDLNVVAQLGSTDAVKEAMKASLGVSIISRLAIEEELKQGTLKEIKLKGLDIKRNFYIISLKKRTLPLAYKRFYEYVLSEAE